MKCATQASNLEPDLTLTVSEMTGFPLANVETKANPRQAVFQTLDGGCCGVARDQEAWGQTKTATDTAREVKPRTPVPASAKNEHVWKTKEKTNG